VLATVALDGLLVKQPMALPKDSPEAGEPDRKPWP